MASTAVLPLNFQFHPPQSHRNQSAVPSGRLRNPSFTNLKASSSSTSETAPSPSPTAAKEDVSQLSGCKACGREDVEKGCNGEGRIQGGIATVPGFGWWPIKAYRPCPGLVESGGRYKRRGQSMDEVAFGRGDRK